MPTKLYQVYRVNKSVVPFSKIPVGAPRSMDEAFIIMHILNAGASKFRREGVEPFDVIYQVEELVASFGEEEVTKP